MKIQWMQKKDDVVAVTDITEAVSSICWSGSVSQAARTAEIAIIHAPDDPNVKKLKLYIGVGDVIQIQIDKTILFFGEVQTTEKTSESGTITYNCTDLLSHLLRSTGVYNFKNTTAEAITKKVCAEFKIKTGEIAESKVPIKKMIVDESTIYDIIMQAYTKASRQTGILYICRMEGTKLTVKRKGEVVQNYILAEGYNITNITYQETIENMVNVVKIINDSGKQIGEIKKEKWIEQYGIYQEIYKKEEGVNEVTAAANLMTGIEKNINLEGVDGNVACIAGNGVEVYDKTTGLKGLFWIDNDSHVWENGVHTMSLELNFKNIMDSREETE